MESPDEVLRELPYVNVYRPAFSQTHFDTDYGNTIRKKTMKERIKKNLACCECTGDAVKKKICKIFPALKWMRHYDFRENILCDVIAGCTIAVMNIPQGMAYALLAGIPAINGLYVAFFPVLIYVLMGTSRHVCVGLVGIVSVMFAAVVERESTPDIVVQLPNESYANSTSLEVIAYDSIQVAAITAFIVGILQVLMGLFNLGFVAIYLSEPLVSGFTTGSAVHVFTSQIKYWFGISIPRFHGIFKVIYSFHAFFKNIGSTNFAEVIISFVCILVLILVTLFINDKYRTKMKMPVPIELLVLIAATLASYYGNFHQVYKVKIVGEVPTGLPAPSIPPVRLFPNVLKDCFIISIISYSITVSLAMIFAKKYHYDIDANQEMIALGSANIFGSIFVCPAITGSLSRTVIQSETGGKTQVVGLISCSIILIVLLVMGPLFESLPVAVLSSIVIVALRGMFLQVRDLKRLWNISKVDFCIWLATCTGVIILDVDIGLLIGIGVSFFSVVVRTQRPHCCIMGKIPHTDIYRDINQYKAATEIPKIKVFFFESPLYFANAQYFKNKLYEKTLNPKKQLATLNKLDQKRWNEEKRKHQLEEKACKAKNGIITATSSNNVESYKCLISGNRPADTLRPSPFPTEENIVDKDLNEVSDILIHHIVIDCSMMSFVDSVGANVILQVMQEYKDANITVFLSNCKVAVYQMFQSPELIHRFSEENLFPSIHDAVLYALHNERKKKLTDFNLSEGSSVDNSTIFSDQNTVESS